MILTDPFMRDQAISLTVQLVAGERCALAASAGLIGCAPDEPSRRFLATQTLKAEVQQMQKEMSHYMLAAFSDRFRDGAIAEQRERMRLHAAATGGAEEQSVEWQGLDLAVASPKDLENTFTNVVLNEFKVRLERLGLEYQPP